MYRQKKIIDGGNKEIDAERESLFSQPEISSFWSSAHSSVQAALQWSVLRLNHRRSCRVLERLDESDASDARLRPVAPGGGAPRDFYLSRSRITENSGECFMRLRRI
jgi:hypothetical protein